MAFDATTLARAAFKRINARAHTTNSKEIANEAIASSITLTFENIIGEQISPTGSQAVADGVALHLSGAHVLSATLDITSNGKAYILTVPSGNLLIGQAKPGGGTFQAGDRAQRIIPQSFGLDFRPVLRSNGIEVPPFDTRDWYLDEFAGIITSEDDLSLVNGTVECYAYVGQYLNQTVASGSNVNAAPISASYITVNSELGLPNERVLTAGSGISIIDNGQNSTIVISTTASGTSDTLGTWNEVPSGAVDGVNTVFGLQYVPTPDYSLRMYVNGQRQKSGSMCDYTLSGSVVTFTWAVNEGSNILADYRFTPEVSAFGDFVAQEIPSGAIDGVNLCYSTEFSPNPLESLEVFRNGLAMLSGTTFDYTLSGPSSFCFNSGNAPLPGSNIFVRYLRQPPPAVSSDSTHVFHEVPSGSIDGVNSIFFLAFVPSPSNSLEVYKNGLAQMSGSTFDYTLADGNVVTFNVTPISGSNIFINYLK